MRRDFLKALFAAGVAAVTGNPAGARRRFAPLDDNIVTPITMKNSPFPYHGENPETHEPFMNVKEGNRLGHQSPRSGVKWEDETYSDRRTLFALPAGFDLGKPAALIVYFHGNDCILERDVVARQHVPAQLAQSGINAVLAAPAFAVDARDSSPGNFWQPGYFGKWLAEVGKQFAGVHGQGATSSDFNRLPVVLIAYSGGYFPAAWVLKQGGAQNRLSGLVLLDALYGDIDKFVDWMKVHHRQAFVFSTFSKITRPFNQQLEDELHRHGLTFARTYPQALKPGQIYFGDVPDDINHVEFLSQAWTDDPLRWTLARIPAYRHRV